MLTSMQESLTYRKTQRIDPRLVQAEEFALGMLKQVGVPKTPRILQYVVTYCVRRLFSKRNNKTTQCAVE